MKLISVGASPRKGKKYMATLKEDSGKIHKVHFGATGYQDFTTSKSEIKKAAYLARHKVTEDWTNPLTAGFWSRWLLWNKSTITASITDIRHRFDL